MKRGPPLSSSEKFIIKKLKRQNYTQKKIADILQQPPSLICTFLKKPEQYGTRKSSGRPPKVSERLVRRIRRLASTGKKTAKEIKAETNAPCTV